MVSEDFLFFFFVSEKRPIDTTFRPMAGSVNWRIPVSGMTLDRCHGKEVTRVQHLHSSRQQQQVNMHVQLTWFMNHFDVNVLSVICQFRLIEHKCSHPFLVVDPGSHDAVS
jgi:hypothetical protein